MHNLSRLQALIAEAIQDSRHYYSAEALPQQEKINAWLQEHKDAKLADLKPIEHFIIAELSETAKAKLATDQLASAYCAALSTLPGNWWGRPGNTDSASGRHLMEIPPANIQGCLATLLDDQSPLAYHGSEISTLAKELEWTVADLAAGFLANMLQTGFDYRAAPGERKAQIASIRQKLAD